MADLQSRPYNPDPKSCCEKCVFGTGEHIASCERADKPVPYVDYTMAPFPVIVDPRVPRDTVIIVRDGLVVDLK